jgi:hypothetical protein
MKPSAHLTLGDRIAELTGAAALACGLGGSAWLLAPVPGFSSAASAAAAAAIGAFIGGGAVRAAPGNGARQALPSFDVTPIETLECGPDEEGELLLEDKVANPPGDTQFVRLFVVSNSPTAGQLQARIEAHLCDQSSRDPKAAPTPWDGSPAIPPVIPPVIPDASDALHAALADIRRSLRRT